MSSSLHNEHQRTNEVIQQRFPNNSMVHVYPEGQQRPLSQRCGHLPCSKPYAFPLYIKIVPDDASKHFWTMCYGCIVAAGRNVADYAMADQWSQDVTTNRVFIKCCNPQCTQDVRMLNIIPHLTNECEFENKMIQCKNVNCNHTCLMNDMPAHNEICEYKMETCGNEECTHQCIRLVLLMMHVLQVVVKTLVVEEHWEYLKWDE